MDAPTSPNLSTAHSQIRSRTPDERNAARKAAFEAKIGRKEEEVRAKNAQPRAGAGIRVDGPQITSTGGEGGDSFVVPNLIVVIDGIGYRGDFLISGSLRRIPDDE